MCHAETYDGTQIRINYAKNSDGKYYYRIGNDWHECTNTNPKEVDREVQEIVNKIVEPINKGFEKKEANKPKSYTYRGVKIKVSEAKFSTKKDGAVPPGIYNFYASVDGSAWVSTDKNEVVN